MKKDYIKPCVCFDIFEVKANILEMSFGGEDGPGKGEARERHFGWSTDDNRSQRGYGSNGSSGSGWGSLW